MADRASADSGDIAGGESSGKKRRLHLRPRARKLLGSSVEGFVHRLATRGELQLMPRSVSRKYHLPLFIALYNAQFFRLRKSYLWQSALAGLVMLGVLLLVDSVADAVLAAGLGSSAVIVFVHPNSSSAAIRHLVGGHLLALAVGAVASFIVFHSGWTPIPETNHHLVADVAAAVTLGFVILVMSATDTEHPPAAATSLGFALQSLELTLVLLFVAAVLVMAAGKVTFRRALRDLD